MFSVLTVTIPIYALLSFTAWLVAPHPQPMCLGLPESIPFCLAYWESQKSDFQRVIDSPWLYVALFLVLTVGSVALARRKS